MGYYILPRPPAGGPAPEIDPAAGTLARWQAELESGSAHARRAALRRLIAARAEDALVQCLASGTAAVVQLAASGLWECWLNEAGVEARREMEIGMDAMNEGALERAAELFARLREHHPGWAEATNKLATVLYLQGKPEDSIKLCREVVRLKPDHFGAWNGLALCAVQIEDWPLAKLAAGESLRLQPHSSANLQLLHLIDSRLV